MQEIAPNIYIEDQYSGVTLGAISLSHGLIQIDAPPSQEDGRAWRATLLNMGGGIERILINLDAHPDRTLGVRAMDCPVIAQEKTAAVFRNRPTTFKAQGEDTGSEWEQVIGLGSIRWVLPEISFSQQMAVHWADSPVLFEHHPGSAAGAAWVVVPESKVVFVGDAVLKSQPPYFFSSHLPEWITALELLMSDRFKGYTVVSGRSGVVTPHVVNAQYEFISMVHKDLDEYSRKKPSAQALEALITKYAALFKSPATKHKQYLERLRYGLTHYFTRHYSSAKED